MVGMLFIILSALQNPQKPHALKKKMRTTTYTGRIGLQTFILETQREQSGKRRYSPDVVFKMQGAPIYRHKDIISVKSDVRLPCLSLEPSEIDIGPYTQSLIRRSNLVFLGVSSISAEKICLDYIYKHLFFLKKPFRLTLRARVEAEERSVTPVPQDSSMHLWCFM